MPVDDLPPGAWTELLVGDQWPGSTALTLLSGSANMRRETASTFERYADRLNAIRTGNLASQEGSAAETTRAMFLHAENKSRETGHTNGIKSSSYKAATQHALTLRSNLHDLAVEGNRTIEEVNSSKSALPVKIATILGIVTEIRSRAAAHAASTIGEISTQIQNVLNTQGSGTSATVFAASNGLSGLRSPRLDAEALREEVTSRLQDLQGATSLPSPPSGVSQTTVGTTSISNSGVTAEPPNPYVNTMNGNGASPAASSSFARPNTTTCSLTSSGITEQPAPNATAGPMSAVAIESSSGITATPMPPATQNPDLPPASPSGVALGHAPSLSTPLTTTHGPTASIDTPAAPAALAHLSPGSVHAATALSPEHLAETFNAGNKLGAPVSAGAEAISNAAASPVHAPPATALTHHLDPAAPAVPHVETAHAAPQPAPAQIASSPTEIAQPVIAPAPTVIAPAFQSPSMSAPLPPAPSGGLVGYGADIRPPVTTAPAPPMPAAPASAPVNPSSGSAHAGQPALVGQQPATPSPQTAATTSVTERAFAATATGAATGAAAADAAAQNRLRRLLESVARQQPKLRWAIGDLDDGSTILVTDVAGGWIPPGVMIPTGIRLHRPAARRSNLTTLLGPAVHTAAYQPGQHLASFSEAEPVSMSIRARDNAAVDDLGWELAQATKWRDGLPRLAHTLAKAVCAGTGVLDSEVDLLRDHLASVASTVIARYPRAVDPAQVANWQLLATIDSLIRNEKTPANYHFAWFQAHALTREERR